MPAEAAEAFSLALRITPDDAEVHCHLAAALASQHKTSEAVQHYRAALKLVPDLPEALNNLAWVLATASDDTLRDGADAARLAERALRLPPVKGMCVAGTLAAAYAEAGRFPEAIATAEKAVGEETAAGETLFADNNRQLLTLYRAGKPWHGTIAKHSNQHGLEDTSP